MKTKKSVNPKHFLTGEELSQGDLESLLKLAESLKKERQSGQLLRKELAGQSLGLIFEKPSLRTRFSFMIAMQELGGFSIESVMGTRKTEEPQDLMRVLNGFCHGIVYRTHAHSVFNKMAPHAKIPMINGLSDEHHPCQILADMQTLRERFGNLKGLSVAYIGDGNNILHSLLLLLPYLGAEVRFSSPVGYTPHSLIVEKAEMRAKESGGSVVAAEDPIEAVKGANAIYTDVWTSMGFETEKKDRDKAFTGYQLNEKLYAHAAKNAVLMHCLPMERGREITDAMADHKNSVLFDQSENRLHAQKALLMMLMGQV